MKIGALIAGRYRIERLAGTGGMGAVYQARDLHRGIRVAVKLNQQRTSSQHAERFSREARALAELLAEIDHPGIVEYIDHGATVDGIPYLIIEWLEGCDLKRRILQGPLSEVETLSMGRQLCSALGAVHSHGIIHRDIKPTNLFLAGGDLERIKLIDFGLVRYRQSDGVSTQTGQLLGTPTFMAPEQARGARDLDVRVDIYSLGAVLFACLAQRPPFLGEHPMAVLAKLQLETPPPITDFQPDVSPALCDLLSRLLAKQPADRPASVDEVAEELRAIETALPERASAARASVSPTVSTAERSFTSIVLIGTTPMMSETEITPDADVLGLAPLAEQFVASIRYLPAGMVLVSLAADTGPVEVAVRAARFALAARERIAATPMAIATGRTSVGAPEPVGDAIDRAIALLPDSDATLLTSASGDPLAREQLIIVDQVSGRLLDSRFDIDAGAVPGGRGMVLRGEGARPGQAPSTGPDGPEYVGRKRELTMLHANFEECLDESVPRVVLITGPPGMGKSRLAYQFVLGLMRRGEPMSVWSVAGDPLTAGAPFGICAEVVRTAFSVGAIRSYDERARRIVAHCRELGCAEPDITGLFLAEMLQSEAGPDGAPQGLKTGQQPGCASEHTAHVQSARADPRLMHDRQRKAWEDWLRAETGRAPVVLILDDLQWSDPASISFVHTALRNLDDSSLMVLALARPEFSDSHPDLWPGCAIERSALKPLSRRMAQKLASQLLGIDSSKVQVERLAAVAEGNPFFMQELALHAGEGPGELPRTVLASISVRLGKLTSLERQILRAASVMGPVFWHSAVVQLTDIGAQEVAGGLSRLVGRDLVIRQRTSRFADDIEYAFHHGLVRETAYAALPEGERQRAHLRAGRWLQRRGADSPLLLAQHFARAGDTAVAAPYFAAAATQALQADDFAAALSWAEQAIDHGESDATRVCMLLLIAEVHNWRGHHESALNCARRAMVGLAPGTGLWAWAVHQAFWAVSIVGAEEQLHPLRAAFLEHLPETPDERYLVALAHCWGHLLRWGQVQHAAAFQQILDRSAGDGRYSPALSAVIEHAALIADLISGRLDRAVERGPRVIATWQKLGHRRQACLIEINLGEVWLALGDYQRAVQALGDAHQHARRLGSHYAEVMTVQGLAMALVGTGEFQRARALVGEYEGPASAPSLRARMGLIKARVGLREGLLVGALGEVERALALFTEGGDSPEVACSSAVKARILLALGRPEQALQVAATARDIAERLGHIEEGNVLVHLVHAEALREVGRAADAADAIERARVFVNERAALITDAQHRRNFTERVAENRRVLELARAWIGG